MSPLAGWITFVIGVGIALAGAAWAWFGVLN